MHVVMVAKVTINIAMLLLNTRSSTKWLYIQLVGGLSVPLAMVEESKNMIALKHLCIDLQALGK